MATKIYTRTGDTGETGLFGGARVAKDDLRVSTYGTVDELNAAIGMARAHGVAAEIDGALATVQSLLFELGASLACAEGVSQRAVLSDADISGLEQHIDMAEAQLPKLRTFILPGGTRGAAALHMARCVCRRAERLCVSLARREASSDGLAVQFLNRLSDLLFVYARLANHLAGHADVPWSAR